MYELFEGEKKIEERRDIFFSSFYDFFYDSFHPNSIEFEIYIVYFIYNFLKSVKGERKLVKTMPLVT